MFLSSETGNSFLVSEGQLLVEGFSRCSLFESCLISFNIKYYQ